MAQLKLPRLKTCLHPECQNFGITMDGKCSEHTSIRDEWGSTPRNVREIQNPIGMELECICDNRAIRKITECVCDDGSLPYNGHEIKILGDASEIGVKAADIARKARTLGARVHRCCGFHVHTSLPGKSRESIESSRIANRFFETLDPIQDEMFELFPTRARSSYCTKFDEGDDLFSHFSWISFSANHPTIEVRIHPGTLSASKIYAWGEVCIGLQKLFHDVIMGRETDRTEEAKAGNLFGLFDEDSVALQYLNARKNQNGRNVRFQLETVEYD